MKRASYGIFALLIAAILPFTAHSGDKAKEPSGTPIPIAEVYSRGIAGELGEPLGKVIRIHATLVNGDTLGFKAAVSNTYLRVTQVEARKLREPVTVQLANGANGYRIRTPAFGQAVTCRGYETGGYSGIVHDPAPQARVVAPAGVGYGFGTEFIAWEISAE